MKKIINLSTILFLITFSISAQRYTRAIKWEVLTHSNNLVFGIAKDKAQADRIMDRFQEKNHKKRNDISNSNRKYARTTIRRERKDQDIFIDFIKLAPRGYKILKKNQIPLFDIVKQMGLEEGLEYYMRNKKVNKSTKQDEELIYRFYKYIHNSKFYVFN